MECGLSTTKVVMVPGDHRAAPAADCSQVGMEQHAHVRLVTVNFGGPCHQGSDDICRTQPF
eukprot:4892924-Amphidinium_carterae.1